MQPDSQQLLARCRDADERAAEAIFQRYTERLLALARSRLSPRLAQRIDPDDVVQSAYRSFFVRARRGEFVAECQGDLWRLLATIALHKLSRQSQRHRAAKRSVAREQPWSAPGALLRASDREPSPPEVAAAVEELDWLLRQFEPLQQQALRLRLEELTAEEIGAAIGRSERTVRRWLVEARELLAARWSEQNAAEWDQPTQSDAPRHPLESIANQGGSQSQPHPFATAFAAPLRHSEFRLESMIGSGGMSKVYVATEITTGRRVAIKVLRKRLRGRSELVERFLREAEIVSRFSHPGIVPILGLGRLPDHNFFIVMELIDGPDLAKACQNTPLTPRRAAEIVGAVADAIEHANQRGVIHRDLKPGNVLVDRNGRVFVTDFGFAWFDSELDRDVGSIVGTAGFMAPEQIDPSLAPIGPPTDVYGLGALLRMLVCGPRSASDDSTGEFADLASRDARGRTDDVGHDVPRALIDIWARCLEPNWQRRFRGAGEVGAALQDWLDGEKAPASAPPQSAETNRQAQ